LSHQRWCFGRLSRSQRLFGVKPEIRDTLQKQQRPDKPVFLTIKADRTLAIGDDPVSRETLALTLETAANGNHDERIFLRADRAVTYGDVMEIMNSLRSAGFLKVALVGLEEREAK
jgi:biopolymer transport protein ExbD